MGHNLWYLEMIDVRTGNGVKTGLGAAFTTEDEVRAKFEASRGLAVPDDRMAFLVDLHNPNGDLLDTIQIDADGFEAIIGHPPESPDVYTAVDRAYWAKRVRP